MHLLSFLRSSPEKQIQKARKRVKEPHGDPTTRINAAQRLRDMGTPAAILALLDRFVIDVSPSTQDEQEKTEVLAWLVDMGEEAVLPLTQFLKNERQLYWPLRALREILSPEKFSRQLEDILRYHWENPPASSEPKAQLIQLLGNTRTSDLVEVVKLFLKDESDDVRLVTLDYLFEGEDESPRETILDCYLDSEDRPRVRNKILECLVSKTWSVRGYRPKIEKTLPDGYALSRDGKVKSMSSGS